MKTKTLIDTVYQDYLLNIKKIRTYSVEGVSDFFRVFSFIDYKENPNSKIPYTLFYFPDGINEIKYY